MKIYPVTNCHGCPNHYDTWREPGVSVDLCSAMGDPKEIYGKELARGKKTDTDYKIPKWCPLEDKIEYEKPKLTSKQLDKMLRIIKEE